ncbi:glycoside hydrolase family 16 protein [Xylaria sp. FL0933]|nr:glycoside hydrolase family 16 protein [Xylaria sp. FL0933]
MAYSLATHYAGQGLLDSFSFFTGDDPTNGFVNYQSREAALASDLVSIDESNRVKLGVDSINTYSTSDKGRPSVRITSNDQFTHGLFIADFAHMPGSTCGTWPAFWAFNNAGNWPSGGEVDIIEGANTAEKNLFSAHTTPGCQAPSTGFTALQGSRNCSTSPDNVGCYYAAPKAGSGTYGHSFNVIGGGVYAMEWDSKDIKIWHFPRIAIPYDISNAPISKPDPSRWGPPQARFGGSECDADSHFYNMSLVINTNFCGAYAGDAWGVTDICNKLAPTCEEFVASNPSSFRNAFWQINYIDVYKRPEATNTSLPIFPNTTTSSIPTPSAIANTTSLGNTTVTPSKTRTITVTVSTITQSISTAQPTQTGGGLADPATIDGWTLLGCFGSLDGYKSFSQQASFPTMDNEACVSSCAGHRYAGVSGETCYCADVLGNATAVANDKCSVPCPGNPRELCGGVLSATDDSAPPPFANLGFPHANSTQLTKAKLIGVANPPNAPPIRPRAGNTTSTFNTTSNSTSLSLSSSSPPPSSVFLTVYGSIDADIPLAAPGMGGKVNALESLGDTGSGLVQVQKTVTTTVTFTTICATDAAKLITLEYYATLTASQNSCRGCGNATVPMTTLTQTCAACGPRGASTVTLTVPQAVANGSGGRVVAVAVQTVVPVLNNASFAAAPTTSSVTTVVGSAIPVIGAGTSTYAGYISRLGYGVGLWFFVFGMGVLL